VWIDKLTCGVLRILTPLGPRYVTPSRPQRILLLWMFRHFHTLPQQVLSGWQQDLIDTLCAEHKFVSAPHDNVFEAAPIVGTLERQNGSTGSAVFSAPGALRTFRLCHCAMVGHTTSPLTATAAAVRLPCALREWQASASQPFRPAPPRGAGRTGRSCRLGVKPSSDHPTNGPSAGWSVCGRRRPHGLPSYCRHLAWRNPFRVACRRCQQHDPEEAAALSRTGASDNPGTPHTRFTLGEIFWCGRTNCTPRKSLSA